MTKSKPVSRQYIKELEARLAESEETLRAIREGEVDAITERKQIEREREVTIDFLRLLGEGKSTSEIVRLGLEFFARLSGCEAIGVRLKKGEYFPYYGSIGFSPEFIERENRFCAFDPNGKLLLNSDGPVAECMCGSIIAGKFAPDRSYFSPGGSFWANSTSEFLLSAARKELPACPRFYCNEAGYESLALVPLCAGAERLGVLHLADRRRDMFVGPALAFWEQLANAYSVALARVRSEEALRSSEEIGRRQLAELQSIYESSAIGLSVMDKNLRWLRINRRLAEMNGFPPEAHIGRTVRELLPDLADQAELTLRRVLETGEPLLDMELTGETPARPGLKRIWKESFLPLRDADGNVIGLNVVCEEITERKRAEERARLLSEVTGQLLASDHPQAIVEQLCRKVMEHLDCHAFFNFLVDEELGRMHLNACAGVPDEQRREIEWLDFGVAVCGCVARDGCRIIAEDIQHTSDVRADLVRGYGIQAYACHPLMNQGKVIGTLSFGSRTKTAFPDDELELMKTVADHVAIAMQRIRLIESLNSQVRAAQAANEAKSQFLANMSHELRTPMNAILGLIDVALPKAKNETVIDCLQTAKGSADLLLTLLNDLLDTARIESGRLQLESAPFSLRSMLRQITGGLSIRASEKGLRFGCNVSESVPDDVLGDRSRLQQVLLNLAGNAIKFTERGEVEISVRSGPRGSNTLLEFSVRDTGIGIPKENLEQIFHPFTQGDASMVRRFGGTGLGLTIAKNLIEMMGGQIVVESNVTSGSTFSFSIELPLAVAAPGHADTASSKAVAKRKLQVLLAEDNPANQKLATYILKERGHMVSIAVDGSEAVRLAAQGHYDVILMDVQMPVMNGMEAASEIRRRKVAAGRVPIIAMTAYAMKEDRERCLAAGMDGYISKPVNAEEMIRLVESLAEGIQTSAQSSPYPASDLPNAKVFDPELAFERCFKSREMVEEMIQCFLMEVKTIFPEMRAALEKHDFKEVGRLGHRMKGTVVYLGAEPARDAAFHVEQLGRAADCSAAEVEKAIEMLESSCLELQSELNVASSSFADK